MTEEKLFKEEKYPEKGTPLLERLLEGKRLPCPHSQTFYEHGERIPPEVEKLLDKPFTPPPPVEIEKPPEYPKIQLIRQTPVFNRYEHFEIDLTQAHENAPIGISQKIGRPVSFMVIIQADDDFYYRLNSPTAPSLKGQLGIREELMEINEIYITNQPSSNPNAKAVIRVMWYE